MSGNSVEPATEDGSGAGSLGATRVKGFPLFLPLSSPIQPLCGATSPADERTSSLYLPYADGALPLVASPDSAGLGYRPDPAGCVLSDPSEPFPGDSAGSATISALSSILSDLGNSAEIAADRPANSGESTAANSTLLARVPASAGAQVRSLRRARPLVVVPADVTLCEILPPVVQAPPPARADRSNRGRTLPPEVLTRAECLALLSACSLRSPTGRRNRAIILLLWRAGLRCAEALALRPCDVDLSAGTIRVLRGKGSKARTSAIDPEAAAGLQLWIDSRSKLGIHGSAPLLCTLTGGPLSTSYVRALLPRLARRAKIDKRVHPHGLRHTHAAELRAEGIEIGVISRQLGHSSISTTARYVDHLQPAAVIQAIRARSM